MGLSILDIALTLCLFYWMKFLLRKFWCGRWLISIFIYCFASPRPWLRVPWSFDYRRPAPFCWYPTSPILEPAGKPARPFLLSPVRSSPSRKLPRLSAVYSMESSFRYASSGASGPRAVYMSILLDPKSSSGLFLSPYSIKSWSVSMGQSSWSDSDSTLILSRQLFLLDLCD